MATLNLKNLPEDLHRKLKKRAKEEHRSVAGHVRWLIEQDVGRTKRYTVDDLKGFGKGTWKGVDIRKWLDKERSS